MLCHTKHYQDHCPHCPCQRDRLVWQCEMPRRSVLALQPALNSEFSSFLVRPPSMGVGKRVCGLASPLFDTLPNLLRTEWALTIVCLRMALRCFFSSLVKFVDLLSSVTVVAEVLLSHCSCTACMLHQRDNVEA